MTTQQFNEAVLKVKAVYPTLILGKRYSSTVGGKVFLHQMCKDNLKDGGPKTSNFEFFNSLGLSLSHGHFFSTEEVTDAESEFQNRQRPIFMKSEKERLTSEDCHRPNTILYNDKMCGWNLLNKGYLSFAGGCFGNSEDVEFVKWLIATKQVPW